MLSSPNQNPALITSREYASCVTLSAAGIGGATLPENLVHAKSNECQNMCTGLHLPVNRLLNFLNTGSICVNARQARVTKAGS